MREILGLSSGETRSWWIVAAFLVLLSSTARLGAQCYNPVPNQTPQLTVSPSYWAPGQNYTVTVTNPQGNFIAGTFNPPVFVITAASYDLGSPGYTTEDPNVTLLANSNGSYATLVSPTQITFNVSVSANATAEDDALVLWCYGNGAVMGPGSILITPCALPVTPGPLTIQPGTWVAGQQTPITITGSNFIPSSNPNNCISTGLAVTAGSENVSITNINVVSSTQITATVQPQITDPAETATVTVSNYQYNNPGTPLTSSTTAQIVPTTCIVPHISSVSPNEWFAGNSYRNVAFTGTNFTTSSKATATCPVSKMSITTADGSVTVSGVNVSSATKMTGTVKVQSWATTEAATADAYGDTAPTPDADVLGSPAISWANDPDGSNPIISGYNATLTDPSVVVGQQVLLTTTPTAAMLAALPIPLSFVSNPTQVPLWSVSGVNVGGYNPTIGQTQPALTVLTNPGTTALPMTIYWVYPESTTASYQYCVENEDVTPNVAVCPAATTAYFNVTGPGDAAMTITPSSSLSISQVIVAPCLPAAYEYSLQYGLWGGYDQGSCSAWGPETTTPGITFAFPTASSNGTYAFAQVVTGDAETYTESQGSIPCSSTPGLDGQYPYPLTGSNSTSDSPSVELQPYYTNVTRTFGATMYLLWTSNITGSIPVPISSQSWQIANASVANSGAPSNQTWAAPSWQSPLGPNANQVNLVDTQPSQPPYGYPTWAGLVQPIKAPNCPTVPE